MKIIRTSTVPESLDTFCRGLFKELTEQEGYEVLAVSSPGEALDNIERREGIETISLPMERHISPLKDLKSLWQMIRLFRKQRPQLVHSITPKAGLLSMIAARIAGVPVRLHTFTGLVFPTATGLTQKILMLTDRITCSCATHINPEGKGVRDDLIRYNITRKPLTILGHGNVRGIDPEYYSPSAPGVEEKAATIRRPDLFTFIFIGRLVADKGVNELVAAFENLHQKYPATRLLLIGPEERELDPLDPAIIDLIQSHPAIQACGLQADIRPWLAAADALVHPSYREGFPNVVIEAGAMGLPSIVTDINGSREIISEGVNGTIVPPRDIKSLQEAMKKFLTDYDYISSLAGNARKMIEDRYEQSYVRKCLKDFYAEILRNN